MVLLGGRCRGLLVIALILAFSGLARANTATLTIADDADQFIQSFNIYKSTTSGTYGTMPFANVPAIVNGSSVTGTFIDKVPNDKNYFYIVRAVGSTGLESVNSNEVVAAPLPPKPPTTTIQVVPQTASVALQGLVIAQAPVGQDINVNAAIKPGTKNVNITVTYTNP